jgi:translocation and assembly module TamA
LATKNLKYIYLFLRKLACLLVFALLIPCVYAQKYTLNIRTSDQAVIKKLKIQTKFADSLAIYSSLRQLVIDLQSQAYLTASVDSVYFVDNQCNAVLTTGKQYQWLRLSAGNVEDLLLEKIGLERSVFKKEIFDYQQLKAIQSNILTYLENHGYPFAKIKLDSILMINSELSASLSYSKGSYIRFDSLLVEGEGKIKTSFLKNYLQIRQNEPFSQQKVREAERMLRSLPYLKLKKPLEVVFEYDRAFILITLEKVKGSQFDGIVGILPNQEQKNKLLITGQVNLKLANLFNSGKRLNLEWQSLRASSQLFNFEYEHPQLLKTHFDVSGKLNFMKEDTSFFNLSRSIKFAYQLDNIQKISFFAKYNTTSVTDITPAQAAVGQEENRFIRFANTNLLTYGIGYELYSVNDFLKPLRGWQLKIEVGTGNKKITPRLGRNPASDTVFSSVALNSVQWTLNSSVQKFFKIGRSATFLLKSVGGIIFNNQLFMNELQRLGGLNTIRGFNENAFYASRYLVNTAEVRFYFEESSYLFAFSDYALLSYQIPTQTYTDKPFGVGFGISFTTKGGLFNFAYSMGKADFQQLAANQAKVHFGYVSRF